jgi:hypothetical protein
MVYDHNAALSLYKKLLRLYPRTFREQLGESMEQTFNDLCNERRETGGNLFSFVLWTFAETSVGIVRVNLSNTNMKTITTYPNLAALIGFLLLLPFLTLNAIVGSRVEPFFTLIRPGPHTGPLEYAVLAFVLVLIPVGAYIAVRPVLNKGADGKRKFYLVNMVLAALLVVIFVALVVALGDEIYRCDVLQIPNCD